MAVEKSDRFALPLLASGQAQKEITHNEALILIDALLHPEVVSLFTESVPPDPNPGQAWGIAEGATGIWSGEDGKIGIFTAGGWRFIVPRPGMRVFVIDEDIEYRFDGLQWTAGAIRSDGLYVNGMRVVGDRLPAIDGPSGGSFVDNEARVVLDNVLEALVSHGLISDS